MKKYFPAAGLSVIFALILILVVQHTGITDPLHWKIYDKLMTMKCKMKGARDAAKDILFVVIDNETFRKMKERWPFPRSTFAKAIENLKSAGARVIALDFVFYGNSSEEDDIVLNKTLEDRDFKILLGAAIDEDGKINASTCLTGAGNSTSGIVTKLQHPDSVMRRNFTYFITGNGKKQCLLSWEMQVLKLARGIDISSLRDDCDSITFSNGNRETWTLPVEQNDKSFLINFRSRTADFSRVSFYRVYTGDFDPAIAKDKIVFVGFISSVFWDFFNTPLGPLPGITLNANAFLTLYSRDFLRELPDAVPYTLAVIAAIAASAAIALWGMKKALMIVALELALFFAASMLLMICGYVWDYSVFPIAVAACPLLSKKLMDIKLSVWLNSKS